MQTARAAKAVDLEVAGAASAGHVQATEDKNPSVAGRRKLIRPPVTHSTGVEGRAEAFEAV